MIYVYKDIKMPRSLSLTSLQVTALTTSNDTILYNAQSRDVALYGGTDLASTLTQLEINNIVGDCLTLRYNNDANNYANFKMNSSGTFDVKINNGNKSFNIVNHNGSTFGLKLGNTLVTSTATELNYLSGITPGTASSGKALVTDSSNNLSGINDLSTQNLTVAGTLVTASATELNYTDITTAGTAQAAKALVVDTSRNISNINNLTASQLTGTIQTASQPNITTIGELTNLTVTGQITASTLTGTLSTASQPNITTLAGVTSIGASGSTTITGLLQTAGQTNITSVGTLTGLTLSGGISGATTISNSGAITNTLSTASSSNSTGALILSGGIGISNTTDSTSYTNGGSFTTAGGMAIGKKLFVGNRASIAVTDTNTTSAVDTLLLRHELSSGTAAPGIGANLAFMAPDSTGGIISYGRISGIATDVTNGAHAGGLNFYTVYSASFKNAMILSSSSATSHVLTMQGTGSTISSPVISVTDSTASTSSSTGALKSVGGISISNTTDASSNTNGGTITTAGGVAIAKKLYVGSDTNIAGKLTVGGCIMNSTPSASTYSIDFGLAPSNNTMQINLYNGTRGLGAVSGSLSYYSDGPHKWYYNTTSIAGNIGTSPSGTNTMTLSSTGTLTLASLIDGGGSIRATGYSPPASGSGLEMHYAASTAAVFGYNRSTSAYLPLSLNNTIFINGGTAVTGNIAYSVSIGSSTSVYPFFVSTTYNSGNNSPTAEQLYNTSTLHNYDGTAYGLTSIVAIGNIVANSFIGVSDARIKTNIEDLSDSYCMDFIKIVKPKSYNKKMDLDDGINNIQFGFISQDFIKQGLINFVQINEDSNKYLIEQTDNDGFVSEAGKLFSISYVEIIPILTKISQIIIHDKEILENTVNTQQNIISELTNKINILEQKNKNLEDRLTILEQFVNTLEIAE